MTDINELHKLWECSVFVSNTDLPNGADFEPRRAVIAAMESMGLTVTACASNWGNEEFTPKIAKLKRTIVAQAERIAEIEHYNTRLATESHNKSEKIAELEAERSQLMREALEAKAEVMQLRKGCER